MEVVSDLWERSKTSYLRLTYKPLCRELESLLESHLI